MTGHVEILTCSCEWSLAEWPHSAGPPSALWPCLPLLPWPSQSCLLLERRVRGELTLTEFKTSPRCLVFALVGTDRRAGPPLWSACETCWRTPRRLTCTRYRLPENMTTNYNKWLCVNLTEEQVKWGKKRLLELTDLSSTVGMKSYPIPSTSYWVLSVLLISSGSARMEPSGSTPTICTQHTHSLTTSRSVESHSTSFYPCMD